MRVALRCESCGGKAGERPVHVDRFVAFAYPASKVILRVDREVALRFDDDVVKVAKARSHGDTVKDPPTLTKFARAPGDFLCSVGALTPRPFVVVDVEHPADEGQNRMSLPELRRLLPQLLSGPVCGEVVAGLGIWEHWSSDVAHLTDRSCVS